jgi:tetratricopeptide (TPR) repeat protein
MEDRNRQRVLALVGMSLLLLGLLAALSFVVVAVAALGIALLVALVAVAIWAVRRIDLRPAAHAVGRIDLRPAAHAAARTTRAGVATVRTRAPRPHVKEQAKRLGSAARTTAAAAPNRTEALASRAVTGMYKAGLLQVRSVDPGERAQQLNQLGARLRREGEPEQAAEQHRAALEIVRDLGDQQAEAMTLNNLGLALASSGAESAAVEYLEQAVGVLRELGDDEHEGQVIANLGVVYRRQGQEEEAATLFQEALEKIPPASPAYRQVAEELQRAS